MEELPSWPDGAVTVLATGAGDPHAIPVSTAIRTGPRTIHLALAGRRESLRRLRAEPRVALSILAADVACTAHGRATVVEDPLAELDRVVAVRIDVDEIADHRQARFAIDDGVRWHWTEADAAAADAAVRAGLVRVGNAGR
jgi:hypothetical protein